jgi:hypothetical protein
MEIKNEIHKARVIGFLEGKEFVKQAFALAKVGCMRVWGRRHAVVCHDDVLCAH